MKTCSICNKSEPEVEVIKGTKRCKSCRSVYNKTWYRDNIEKAKAIRAAWVAAHPAEVKKIREKYRAKHTEKYNTYMREYQRKRAIERKALEQEEL